MDHVDRSNSLVDESIIDYNGLGYGSLLIGFGAITNPFVHPVMRLTGLTVTT